MGTSNSTQWAGRRIVVCGGSRGIGKDLVLQLSAAKAEILVIGPPQDAPALDELKSLCAPHGSKLYIHTADLSNLSGVHAAVSAARNTFGGAVDGVFLNHLIQSNVDLVTNFTNEHIQRFIEANGTMMIILLRDFLPLLQRGVDRPFICYSNTFGAAIPAPGMGLYGGVKRLVGTLLDSLSQELSMMGSPINVLQFFFGSVATEGYSVSHKVLLNGTGTAASSSSAASALMKAAGSRSPKALGPQFYLPIAKWLVILVPPLARFIGRSIATIKEETQLQTRRFLAGESE
ncbi:hypothetical protein BJ742DRAFT_9963 [Cladochytrium replicatum]|nr:hypothetical protein BJ742DRAFT_9963 [Cladochytrium replicatum]